MPSLTTFRINHAVSSCKFRAMHSDNVLTIWKAYFLKYIVKPISLFHWRYVQSSPSDTLNIAVERLCVGNTK